MSEAHHVENARLGKMSEKGSS